MLGMRSRTVYVCILVCVGDYIPVMFNCPCRLLILILPLVISTLSELQEVLFSIPSQCCRNHCERGGWKMIVVVVCELITLCVCVGYCPVTYSYLHCPTHCRMIFIVTQ